MIDGEEEIGDIFTNNEDVVDGIRKSAEAIGLDPDMVAPKQKNQPEYYAKKNCKQCWGKGVLRYVPSPIKKRNVVVGGKKTTIPGNELSDVWNTSKPEPPMLKNDIENDVGDSKIYGQQSGLAHYVHCSCVRILEEKKNG